MSTAMPSPELLIRLAAFAGIFVLLAAWERALPRRRLSQPRPGRWPTNIAIVALGALFVRLMASLPVPLAAIATALYGETHGLGLLNQWALPPWLKIVIAILVLDLAIWAQHLATHKVPALWRLHRVHHADRDIDVTTALRFHPFEIALSMLWKAAVVLAIGAPVAAVLLFEVVLNATAMFSHSNIRLPEPVDVLLRRVLVTPDMHRVHHSTIRREHDSNYGFNFSIWDRLFRTYTAQPEKGHENMRIGLENCQTEEPNGLFWCLLYPFRRG